jgi:UDP-glucuronate 4-epimerase
MAVLVTGAAGFIGMHVSRALLDRGENVVGVDTLNDYYSVELKRARLAQCKGLEFVEADIGHTEVLGAIVRSKGVKRVIHLAAQAGVRHSLKQPLAYAQSNLHGFVSVLEVCRREQLEHLVYASSSSVYGANTSERYSESEPVDRPLSLYAATKRANELMAHAYSHLYGLPTTGLRFFTVYGPWGRPDMAYYSFSQAIVRGEPIAVFNQGRMERDFTYIDDVVQGVVRCSDRVATPVSPGEPAARVFNIGNHRPVELLQFVRTLEDLLGRSAVIRYEPMQAGDVLATCADVSALKDWVGFEPSTPLRDGLGRFVHWFSTYHGV